MRRITAFCLALALLLGLTVSAGSAEDSRGTAAPVPRRISMESLPQTWEEVDLEAPEVYHHMEDDSFRCVNYNLPDGSELSVYYTAEGRIDWACANHYRALMNGYTVNTSVYFNHDGSMSFHDVSWTMSEEIFVTMSFREEGVPDHVGVLLDRDSYTYGADTGKWALSHRSGRETPVEDPSELPFDYRAVEEFVQTTVSGMEYTDMMDYRPTRKAVSPDTGVEAALGLALTEEQMLVVSSALVILLCGYVAGN